MPQDLPEGKLSNSKKGREGVPEGRQCRGGCGMAQCKPAKAVHHLRELAMPLHVAGQAVTGATQGRRLQD